MCIRKLARDDGIVLRRFPKARGKLAGRLPGWREAAASAAWASRGRRLSMSAASITMTATTMATMIKVDMRSPAFSSQ
jgi:hypothetical protein